MSMDKIQFGHKWCFSVNLPQVTLSALWDVLENVYLSYRANPQYIFCSEQDRKEIERLILDGMGCHSMGSSITSQLVLLCNPTTGRAMHVVALPDLESGTYLFGFVEGE